MQDPFNRAGFGLIPEEPEKAPSSKTFAKFGLPEHARKIRQIKANLRKLTAQAVIDQGREFATAHQKLAKYGEGTWCKWCKEECEMSRGSAENRMHAYLAFGHLDCATVAQFQPSAMYDLSSDESRIRCARKRAIELAEAGRQISRGKAKKLIQEVYDAERREKEKLLGSWGNLDDDLKDDLKRKGKLEPPKGLAGVRRLQQAWLEFFQAWAQARPIERRLFSQWRDAQRPPRKNSA